MTPDSTALADERPPVAAPHTPEDVARGQRAEWAAAVCAGLETLEITGDGEAELAELAAQLRDGDVRRQAVAWPDGLVAASLERAADVLGRAVERGLRVAVAVPNTRLLGAGDPLGVREALRLAEALGGEVVAAQHLAEGALLEPLEAPSAAPAARVRRDLVGDPDDAVAWLVAAGAPAEAARAGVADGVITFAPTAWAYLTRLERANDELHRANTRLARENLGVHDAAAAAVVGRFERTLSEEKDRYRALEAEKKQLEKRLEIETEVARRNDEYFQAARAKLNEPHHRFVEGLHRRTVGRLRALRPGKR